MFASPSIQDQVLNTLVNGEISDVKTYIKTNKKELHQQNMLLDWLYEALRLVTTKGKKEIVELIFDEFPALDKFPGLNVNHQYKFWHDRPRETLVFYAIKFPELLEYLIKVKKAEININITNDDNVPEDQIDLDHFGTPLHLACRDDTVSKESVRILLENGAIVNETVDVDKNKTELYLTNNSDKIFLLLKYGADANIKSDFPETYLPIHHAILNKSITATRLLARATNLNAWTIDTFISPKTHFFNAFLSPLKLAGRDYFSEGIEIIKSEMQVQDIQNKFNKKFDNNIFTLRSRLFGLLELKAHAPSLYENYKTLDSFVINKVIKSFADYDPGNNKNRQEHINNIIEVIENIYRECIANINSTNIDNKIKELQDYCYRAKLNAENEHIANGHYTLFNSKFVDVLNLIPNNKNHSTIFNKGTNAATDEFMELIRKIKLPKKWQVFLRNEIVLYELYLLNNIKQKHMLNDVDDFYKVLYLKDMIESDRLNDGTNKYNNDTKLNYMQILAKKIVDLYLILKEHPEKLKDALVDFHLSILHLKRACDHKSTLFQSDTLKALDQFSENHLEPLISKHSTVNMQPDNIQLEHVINGLKF